MPTEIGVELPKWHDVSKMLLEYCSRLPDEAASQVERLAEISSWLRKERELAFYGDIDFIPTDENTQEDALRAIGDAQFVLSIANTVIGPQ